MKKAEKVWVICVNPECSSCIVNAVYKNKEKAEKWVEQKNRKLKFSLYWVEQSQLI